jgi:hypothetical protein
MKQVHVEHDDAGVDGEEFIVIRELTCITMRR